MSVCLSVFPAFHPLTKREPQTAGSCNEVVVAQEYFFSKAGFFEIFNMFSSEYILLLM